MSLGFAYFVNLQVLLGIWVFFLLLTVQQGAFGDSGDCYDRADDRL